VTQAPPLVRDAAEADLPAILILHNLAIAETTARWEDKPADLAERRAWFAERRAAGLPVLVAEVDGRFAGYAGYAQFRSHEGYRYTMENSVYVVESFQRRGVATALLAELLHRARRAGVHAMVAGIDSDNTTSIALHRKFGFDVVARMPEVGRKFDRWLDLTLMQLILS
jgi:phosphinothricin acetyltransferase